MTLSDEQITVIESTHSRIRINAVAGSGKTATCEEIIRRNTDKKILYLVYNKSMQLEASSRFGDMRHVTVRTTFALAYGAFGYFYRDRLTENFNVYTLAAIMGTNNSNDEGLKKTEFILNLFNEYLNSEFYNVDDFIKTKDYETVPKPKLTSKILTTIFESLRNRNSKLQVPHNFYFKLYHLSEPSWRQYDCVIVDEMQDSSASLVDIIKRNVKVKKMIVVGDRRQSIYGFAGAIDGLTTLPEEWIEYQLTQSFRIGSEISRVLNSYIPQALDKNFSIVGMNKNQKIVSRVDKSKKHFKLCRFNDTILRDAIENASMGKSIYIEGGVSSIDLSYIEGVYNFYSGGKRPWSLRRFSSFSHFAAYSRRISDTNALRAIRFCKEYELNFIHKINTMKRMITSGLKYADVAYSTAHKSKGMTIDIPVIVNNDFYDIIEADEARIDKVQELNCLYVALTRSSSDLQIPDFLGMY